MDEVRSKERIPYWVILELVLWLAAFGISLAVIRGSVALGAILAVWSLHRLAGALAFARTREIRPHGSKTQVLAGWLYFTRTLVLGAALGSFGITVVVARPDLAGVMVGVLLMFISSPILIFGVRLVHRWHGALHESVVTDAR